MSYWPMLVSAWRTTRCRTGSSFAQSCQKTPTGRSLGACYSSEPGPETSLRIPAGMLHIEDIASYPMSLIKEKPLDYIFNYLIFKTKYKICYCTFSSESALNAY